jgi:TonB family protein
MTRGKSICNVLKTIRKQVAEANEIKYEPRECHHQGECRGTCPACEAEVRYIERQLDIRKQLGKAVTIVGISAGLSALSACGNKTKEVEEVEKSYLTEGMVLTQPATHLTGDIDYRSPEDCVIVEERQPTAKTRTAKFKTSPKKEQVDTTLAPSVVGQIPETIFGDVVEQMPSFPGGQNALFEYLTANVRYPDDCEETCVQGRVIVSFVVERDGSVAEAKVVKSVYPSLDEEALRVVSGMPKWIPGKLNGESVRTKYTIPITFRIQ